MKIDPSLLKGLVIHEQFGSEKRNAAAHSSHARLPRGEGGAPDSFASFRASEMTRTPAQILAHIGDLLDWALSIAKGTETWQHSAERTWPEEIARFHASPKLLDEYLASDDQLHASCERLFQGPIADALTPLFNASSGIGNKIVSSGRKIGWRVSKNQ